MNGVFKYIFSLIKAAALVSTMLFTALFPMGLMLSIYIYYGGGLLISLGWIIATLYGLSIVYLWKRLDDIYGFIPEIVG